jgi:hypothetical protein
MAELISKVVRSGSVERGDDWHSRSTNHTASRTHTTNRTFAKPTIPQSGSYFGGSVRMNTNISGGRADGPRDEDQGEGIMKTVTMVVQSDVTEDSCEGYQVKTKRLTGDFSSTKSLRADDSASQ